MFALKSIDIVQVKLDKIVKNYCQGLTISLIGNLLDKTLLVSEIGNSCQSVSKMDLPYYL